MSFLDTLASVKANAYEKYEYGQRELCKSLVKHPGRHCLFHWSLLVIFAVIVVFGGFFELSDLSINDFIVIDDIRVQNFLLNGEINSAADRRTNNLVVFAEVRSDPRFEHGGLIIYESSDDNLFSPDNVREMCEIESLFLRQADYPFFCPTAVPRGLDTRCSSQILSFSFVFYGNELNCTILSEEEIENKLDNMLVQQEDFMFDDFQNPKAIRSVLFVGGPLGEDSPPNKRFRRSSGSTKNEQATGGYSLLIEDYRTALFDFFGVKDRPIFTGFDRRVFTTGRSTLRTRVGGPLIESIELERVLFVDQMLSAGSYIVVTLLVASYIRSIVLAVISMVSILLSLVAAIFVFAVVLQFNYFTPLNILVLFLIAGIGADNVLVLADSWRQSELDVKRDIGLSLRAGQTVTANMEEEFLVNRLVYAFERAALAVSNTAITTFIAFLATAISPIPAIAGLGVFASITILINWWFMFTVHPANLMWHYYVFVRAIKPTTEEIPSVAKSKGDLGNNSFISAIINLERGVHDAAMNSSKRLSIARVAAIEADHQEDDTVRKLSNLEINASSVIEESLNGSAKTRKASQALTESFKAPNLAFLKKPSVAPKEKEKFRCLDAFFAKYSYVANETLFPYVAVVGITGVLIVLGIAMSQLATPSSIESNFPEGHMFSTFLIDFGTNFLTEEVDSFTAIFFILGVNNFDVSDIPKLSNDKSGGKITFDEEFEIFSQESQDFLFRLCSGLPEFTCDLEGCQEDTVLLQVEEAIDCRFLELFDFILAKPEFNSTVVGAPGGPPDEETFNALAVEAQITNVGLVDGRVRFIRIKNHLSMKRLPPLIIKEPVFEIVDQMIDTLIEEAPSSMRSLRSAAEEQVLLVTEQALISGMFQGLGISLIASFFVLLLGTQSLRIAFLAILSVAGVAIAVLGTIQLQGGELGTAESVAGVFIIGLSVDYIVHLGHMFKHSVAFIDGEDNPKYGSMRIFDRVFQRNEKQVYKTKDMLDFTVKKMGPTILAGALTTFFSALFLSLCTFAFFGKMSNLLMLTVVYAVLMCILFFVPLLRLFGPGKK